MNDQSNNFPKFYMTAPSPCPYLDGKMERKVFTDLNGIDSLARHESFNKIGFRRSQNIVYRPACDGCSKCVSVRVITDEFQPSKSMKRTLKKFENLILEDLDPVATYEQFDLLKSYLKSRHGSGGMAEMDEFEYSEMVELSPITTRVVEYREPALEGKFRKGNLAGVSITDVLSDGLSLVYSFFRTDERFSGLGTFIILDHIRRAANAGLPFVYLGYWVEGSTSMDYKARFQPQERLNRSGWRRNIGDKK
jgi:arginine-tRNA-protein transferase